MDGYGNMIWNKPFTLNKNHLVAFLFQRTCNDHFFGLFLTLTHTRLGNYFHVLICAASSLAKCEPALTVLVLSVELQWWMPVLLIIWQLLTSPASRSGVYPSHHLTNLFLCTGRDLMVGWWRASLHYGKVSMGGVTFRISNFLTTLKENITFTFYFNDFCLKLPL